MNTSKKSVSRDISHARNGVIAVIRGYQNSKNR